MAEVPVLEPVAAAVVGVVSERLLGIQLCEPRKQGQLDVHPEIDPGQFRLRAVEDDLLARPDLLEVRDR